MNPAPRIKMRGADYGFSKIRLNTEFALENRRVHSFEAEHPTLPLHLHFNSEWSFIKKV